MNRHALRVASCLAVAMAGCEARPTTDSSHMSPGTPHALELKRPPHDPDTPDLTEGEGPDLKTASRGDWFLHSAGCRGWIYKDKKGKGDKARQILITRVPVDSSLRRTLKVGDVILGVNGNYFSSHAVYEFRKTSLPAKSISGKFDVILFRKGWEKEGIVEFDLAYLPLDFMLGEEPGLAVDWNLGPTGARGWLQGRHEESIQARQILVTSVEAGSPADGILQKGDVILGVEGKAFDRDARRAFGEAVTRAETEAGGGRLRVSPEGPIRRLPLQDFQERVLAVVAGKGSMAGDPGVAGLESRYRKAAAAPGMVEASIRGLLMVPARSPHSRIGPAGLNIKYSGEVVARPVRASPRRQRTRG